TKNDNRTSEYNLLKEIPKSATLSHMKEIQNRLLLLTDFIEEIDSLLEDIPNLKIKHFALGYRQENAVILTSQNG
ncbi:UNVERIFIED_CONTAM: hypothetical protein ODR73_23565, partial [Escherichia coli]